MPDDANILRQLMAVIADRKKNPPAKSYTTKLLTAGGDRIGVKIMEEVVEIIDAAREGGEEGHRHVVREAADVIYHLFVLLGSCDVGLEEVETELARRFGLSGLDEKASRSTTGQGSEPVE